jgi:hypothetical protein
MPWRSRRCDRSHHRRCSALAVGGYTHNRRPLQPVAPSSEAWEAAHLAAHRLVATEQGRVLAWAALVSGAEQAGMRLGRLHGRWRDVLLLERRGPVIG